MRVLFNLFALNICVLATGAGVSYWLARRTMRPIEEAMQAKDRFTADASHELRTPLAAMKAEIEVALRDKKRSKAETEELLRSNLEEVDRLSHLAEGLLVLTNESQEVHKQPTRLDESIKKVCSRLETLASAKQIRLSWDASPITIVTDPIQLEKILGILVDNAIKYSPQKTEVHVAVRHAAGQTTVQVIDQGYGIKASDLPHVFDRFYRADVSRSKEHIAGHGLGLSIAHTLATSLDGTLTAESAPGKGSTFTLTFPF